MIYRGQTLYNCLFFCEIVYIIRIKGIFLSTIFFAEFGIILSRGIIINLIDSNLYRQKVTKPLAFVRYYIVLIISYEPAIIIEARLCY